MIRADLLASDTITADQREVWDAIVSECDACAAMPYESTCGDHDLDEMTSADLRALVAAWLRTG